MAALLAPYIERLTLAAAALHGLRPAVEAGEPWPLAERFGVEPEASWGPREVLAHLAEMFPYWYAQIELILGADAGPVPFGRTQEDPNRIAAIGRDRSLPLGDLFDRIGAGIEPYRSLLPGLSDAKVGRTGQHPTRGEIAIPEIVERLVVGHFEAHVAQLRETLDRR